MYFKPHKSQTLKDKAWTVFSLYRRLQEADSDGYCKCIVCRKKFHYKNIDVGHYFSRKHTALMFDEQNTNTECRADNSYNNVHLAGYSVGLVRKYGGDILEKLLTKKNMIMKYTDLDYIRLINYWKQEIKRIKKEKNI